MPSLPQSPSRLAHPILLVSALVVVAGAALAWSWSASRNTRDFATSRRGTDAASSSQTNSQPDPQADSARPPSLPTAGLTSEDLPPRATPAQPPRFVALDSNEARAAALDQLSTAVPAAFATAEKGTPNLARSEQEHVGQAIRNFLAPALANDPDAFAAAMAASGVTFGTPGSSKPLSSGSPADSSSHSPPSPPPSAASSPRPFARIVQRVAETLNLASLDLANLRITRPPDMLGGPGGPGGPSPLAGKVGPNGTRVVTRTADAPPAGSRPDADTMVISMRLSPPDPADGDVPTLELRIPARLAGSDSPTHDLELGILVAKPARARDWLLQGVNFYPITAAGRDAVMKRPPQ